MSKEFKHESIGNSEMTVQHLKAFAEGFANGQIVLGTRQEQFILEPSNDIKLKVKVKRKDGKIKVSLKFVWVEDMKAKSSNRTFELIGAGAL